MEAMTEEGSDSQPPSNSWWHKSAFTKVSGYKDGNVPISSINTSSFTIISHRPLQPSPVAPTATLFHRLFSAIIMAMCPIGISSIRVSAHSKCLCVGLEGV